MIYLDIRKIGLITFLASLFLEALLALSSTLYQYGVSRRNKEIKL